MSFRSSIVFCLYACSKIWAWPTRHAVSPTTSRMSMTWQWVLYSQMGFRVRTNQLFQDMHGPHVHPRKVYHRVEKKERGVAISRVAVTTSLPGKASRSS
ncbi:hypothetical protein EDD16DRAFT_1547037 [Pisolithus croceorrhizus]|nr:hypothetical protein EDD16DRAFT_1547037 [Pisolithus croceorrhizus]KAI6162909.1 hypothetical protein EDD17DRAFT_1573480 [Pisolithus thermaeus]